MILNIGKDYSWWTFFASEQTTHLVELILSFYLLFCTLLKQDTTSSYFKDTILPYCGNNQIYEPCSRSPLWFMQWCIFIFILCYRSNSSHSKTTVTLSYFIYIIFTQKKSKLLYKRHLDVRRQYNTPP